MKATIFVLSLCVLNAVFAAERTNVIAVLAWLCATFGWLVVLVREIIERTESTR